jgi:hypothetical protein
MSASNHLLVALPHGLTRRAEGDGDHTPGPTGGTGCEYGPVELGLGAGHGPHGVGDGTKVRDVLSGSDVGVELVEPRLSFDSSGLELFAGAGHGHHLSEVAVELGLKYVGVDDNGFVAVRVKDDDFEQVASGDGTSEEDAVLLYADDGDGVADGVEDVLVGDAVLAGAIGDLHNDNIHCQTADGNLNCRERCIARAEDDR